METPLKRCANLLKKLKAFGLFSSALEDEDASSLKFDHATWIFIALWCRFYEAVSADIENLRNLIRNLRFGTNSNIAYTFIKKMPKFLDTLILMYMILKNL
jgi:hypothetical protein